MSASMMSSWTMLLMTSLCVSMARQLHVPSRSGKQLSPLASMPLGQQPSC